MLHQVLLMLARSSLITHAHCTARLQVCYEARKIEMTARTGNNSLPANLKSQTAKAQSARRHPIFVSAPNSLDAKIAQGSTRISRISLTSRSFHLSHEYRVNITSLET
ncbi:hypothetical protein BJX62DRAFT_197766 [Aspergillus germanicus]